MATPVFAHPQLREAIERTGYYPNVVQDVLIAALGPEQVQDFIVQHETTFDRADEIRRHITVLLLTDSRLVVVHVDEHSDGQPAGQVQASSATESVPLSLIGRSWCSGWSTIPRTSGPGTCPQRWYSP